MGIKPLIPASSSNAELLRTLSLEHNAMIFVFPEGPRLANRQDQPEQMDNMLLKQGWKTLHVLVDGGDDFGTYAVRPRTRTSNITARRLWSFLKSGQAKDMARAVTQG